jgi:hypothetical protein
VSVDGVSHPGGNVDLEAGTGITISPNQTTRTISIGTQGLLLASDYDLRQRAVRHLSADHDNHDQEELPVSVPFQPRIVLVVGDCSAELRPDRTYGGAVSGFADLAANTGTGREQWCSGYYVRRFSDTDWHCTGFSFGGAICYCEFYTRENNEVRAERLELGITAVSATQLTVKLYRQPPIGLPNAAKLSKFLIFLHLLCMG